MNIIKAIPCTKLQELETGQVLKQLKYIEMVLSFLSRASHYTTCAFPVDVFS